MTLALYALIALPVALLWIVFGRDSAEERVRPPGIRNRRRRLPRGDLPAGGVGVIIVGFSAFLASHGLRSWLPQILEARGMSPATSGLLASLPAITGVLGSILILRLASRGVGNRRRATLALLLVTGLCVAAIISSMAGRSSLVIALEGFCAAAIQPLMLNILMEMPSVGPRRMGTAAGIFFSVGEVGGTLGPVFMGLLADLTGSFTPGLIGMAAIMWIMLVPALRIRA